MKIFFSISLLAALLLSSGLAHANPYDPNELYGYNVTRVEATDLGGAASNGNERSRLKNLADIARASKPAIHRDASVNADYMCDWVFDTVSERYVCQKNYAKAYEKMHPQPIPVCPFGYKLDYGRTNCVKILYPMNARLNDRGDGWVCNPGYHLNYTGTVCLGPEYTYKQCPGKSDRTYSYRTPSDTVAIAAAIPVIINESGQIIEPTTSPEKLPQTGPGLLILLAGSAAGAYRFNRTINRS